MNIEQLTGQVMANQKAAAIYAELDMADPVTGAPGLADEYLQAKLAGDAAQCLALELYCRQVAMTFFHMPGVVTMLRDVERYKAMRKPGTGAPKMLKDIAGQIEYKYSAGDYQRVGEKIVFMLRMPAGNYLKITCKDLPGAVALVAAKYRRGLPAGFGNGRAAR